MTGVSQASARTEVILLPIPRSGPFLPAWSDSGQGYGQAGMTGNPMFATPYLTARQPGARRPGPPASQQPGGGHGDGPDRVTLTGSAATGPPAQAGAGSRPEQPGSRGSPSALAEGHEVRQRAGDAVTGGEQHLRLQGDGVRAGGQVRDGET